MRLDQNRPMAVHGHGAVSQNRVRLQRNRPIRVITAGTALAAVGSLFLGSTFATAASPAKGKLTLLQQGQAFYRGKTITFIAATSAGSGNDRNSRAVSQELATELGATVNVVNIGTAGGVAAGNQLVHSVANGLTIGYITPENELYDVIENLAGYNFNPERVAFLGGIPDGYQLLVTQSNSAYPNFASLLQANPGFATQSNDSQLQAGVMMKAFGINVKWVTGYSSSGTLLTGFLRGDAPLAFESLANVGTSITSGVTRVLAVQASPKTISSNYPGYSVLSSYPTTGALEAKYPAKTRAEKQAREYLSLFSKFDSFTLTAPGATPPSEVRALQWAAKLAIRSNYVKATLASEGVAIGYTAPAALKANYVAALKDVPGLASVVNG